MDIEESIIKAKDDFFLEFKKMLSLVRQADITSIQIRDELTNLNSLGVKYLNLFERSISEYGIEKFKCNDNVRNSKIDDSVNILNTIVKYWKLLNQLKDKYQILIPEPSERAYSSTQVFLKTFDPEKAKEIELKFRELKLPVFGFESQRIHCDMTGKKQITYGIVVGTLLLIALLIIGLLVECPTKFQERTFTTILALAAAAFAAAIPGLIDVKYKDIITASGAIAVFVIVFLLKPAELSDFKSCQKDISGTVYYGERPQPFVELRLLKQNQLTTTDAFGNFNLHVDYSSIDSLLKIQLTNIELKLDTIVSFTRSGIRSSLDIIIKKHCVTCSQSDSTGRVVKEATACSASYPEITKFITDFTNASRGPGLTVNCVRK